VTDEAFDAFYPDAVRAASAAFWTPVDVALEAAAMLVTRPGARVLDVGSGAGKFCVVGALATGASFVGVEKQRALAEVARDHAARLGASARFVVGRPDAVDWSAFDAIYLFDPFRVLPAADGPGVEIARERPLADILLTERLLSGARPGTRVVTYCGFGGDVPDAYEPVPAARSVSPHLRLWVKR
jgi:SAM-dependent methyltransferase